MQQGATPISLSEGQDGGSSRPNFVRRRQATAVASTDRAAANIIDLVERERLALARIAAGVSLADVLDGLLRAVEEQSSDGMLTSVLLLSEDGLSLRHGAAPSLPAAYNRAIDGFAIGEGHGSCGTAAARRTPVYVSDIAVDPLWSEFREIALSLGLRSCWSTPVVGMDGQLLGTFAIYYPDPKLPAAADIGAIAYIAQTAALAIERHLSDRGLHQAREELQRLNGLLARQVTDRTQERDRLWSLSQDPFLICDAAGVWQTMSPAWSELLGWREDELIGRTSDWLEHSDEVGHTKSEIARLAHGAKVGRFESRLRSQGGDFLSFSWTVVADRDRFYCVARNVTDERARERELKHAQELLRQAQKMEAMGQLTGGVAHDFNNLLTVIQGAVDLLQRPETTPERRARYLEAIAETTARAGKLTSQLLAFARRQALRPEVFEVGGRLEAITQMLGAMSGARIAIAVEPMMAPCFVRADLSQFETAVVNLVVNARDAVAGEGQIRIRVRCGVGRPARGSQSPDGPFVAVEVMDSGNGIAPEHLARIFEPFFTTKPVGKGTGLGLSQVFGFAKQSGGDVDVSSSVGVGTSVTIFLPRVEAKDESVEEMPASDDGEHDGAGRRVLIVEDDLDIGRFAVELLEASHYRPTLVPSAEEALTLIDAQVPFDLLFSDVMMAGIGGRELARQVRHKRPSLPVILASGFSDALIENDARYVFLQKPYSAQQLMGALQQADARQSAR